MAELVAVVFFIAILFGIEFTLRRMSRVVAVSGSCSAGSSATSRSSE